jgi:GTP 3',8-cyclase
MAAIIPIADQRTPRADALDAFVREAIATPQPTGPLLDVRGRPLSDLRISVTDRCNFRCVYCMPKDVFDGDYTFLQHSDLLTFEEITRLARVFATLGVRKLRLTGGEPLLRRKVERLVAMLHDVGDLDLTLTTNGSLLARKAAELRAAGLSRVTVSLDSLDDATFRAMNDVDFPVAKVLEGIDAAAAAGLAPVKVNMVVKRGVNEGSVVAMARHFKGTGHIVRFIEFMDVGATNGWRMDDVVPAAEIVRMIAAEMPLVPADPHYRGEVAERWAHADGSGEIGVIASVTQAFCRDCTRARLSTEGKLYTCLFADSGFDLRALLREGCDDEALRRAIVAVWRQRADRYSEIRTSATARAPKVEMSYIGG